MSSTFLDDFSKEIFLQTYSFNGTETIDETHARIAKCIASVESNPSEWEDKFLELLADFKFVPGGRILSNAGLGLKGTSLINCFVAGFSGKEQDSMEGILRALRDQALILKSEGGYGFCADVMRPRGGYISGIANESPGSVRMLDLWDTQSTVITAGSGNKSKKGKMKIRKGAQMVTMSVWHPDICEFILSKQTSGKLTKFNMSVLVSDDFMEAVLNHSPWSLVFPDYESCIVEYDETWDGNLDKWVSMGLPTKVYRTFDDANELWNLIMKSTYTRNEPGVLFHGVINRYNNLNYVEYISATNPCGEQILPVNGACLLGSINLTQFVNVATNDWDYDALYKTIQIAVRFMDNVNDVTMVPLEGQRLELKNKRRIGLGIMGYGSALMMMRTRYGSKEALEKTTSLMRFISNLAYKTSAIIAKEKGSFLMYDAGAYLESEFLKNLDVDTIECIRENGMRNSHLLSIQPTGNTGVLANIVSGGLEPVFMSVYTRTSTYPYVPEHMDLPRSIDYVNKTFESSTRWEWVREGDENMLRFVDAAGVVWKFDMSRGLLKETIVKDYAVRYLESIDMWDPSAEWAKTTTELTIDDHVETMSVLSKYIDSAMSKTINIPSSYSYDDFKDVYIKLYNSGTIKGGTTYRAGTMSEVLSSVDKKQEVVTSGASMLKKRPRSIEASVVRFINHKEHWIAFVGLVDGNPYEIFTGLVDDETLFIPKNVKSGFITKHRDESGVSRYDFTYVDKHGEKVTFEGISRLFDKEYWNYAKLISGNLRHGMPISCVIDQVTSLHFDNDAINSWKTGIIKALKPYVKDGTVSKGKKCDNCGGSNIVYQEGCLMCVDCGSSKCG